MLDPQAERRIDLNADLGEEVTDDEALLFVVTSANVACGYHAGTAETMQQVCARAAEQGVSVGAQVSYDDRPNFGRVPLDVPLDVLREQVADQIGTLSAFAVQAGTQVRYVKPHGALYHRAIEDPEQAEAVLAGSGELPVLGMPGALLAGAESRGRRAILEGFADRGYGADGRLLPRSEPGALLTDPDEVAAHAVRLADQVDSICVHGDTPGAVRAAAAVRRALDSAGWTLVGL